MYATHRKWRMLFGITFLLSTGVALCWLMAILELFRPRIAESYSNCWWYGVVKFWQEGGAVVMRQSSYTMLPHFDHTFDFEIFSSFNPPFKYRRFLPPPLFNGTVYIVPKWVVLQTIARKDRRHD